MAESPNLEMVFGLHLSIANYGGRWKWRLGGNLGVNVIDELWFPSADRLGRHANGILFGYFVFHAIRFSLYLSTGSSNQPSNLRCMATLRVSSLLLCQGKYIRHGGNNILLFNLLWKKKRY